MLRQRINEDWTFYAGGESPYFGVAGPGVPVDLPHDFSIAGPRDPLTPAGVSNGYFPGGLGCYKKTLFIPEDWRGKRLVLEFESVYMNATVRLNRHLAGRHVYGYTGFFCDITPFVDYSCDNVLSVDVNNSAVPNSRWYSGAGIYRHVWLSVRDSVHIAPWGVYAVTREANCENAVLKIQTALLNEGTDTANVRLRTTLQDADGGLAAAAETAVTLTAGESLEQQQTLAVPAPTLWSPDQPYLYTLKSQLVRGDEVIDETETGIGIRTLSFDAKQGFLLNGVETKLKGGCVHHDNGLLGAAAYDRAEERKAELHKQNGFNAVRCAHNPPSPAFLDACDRLGLLVIDEAFDTWRESKNPNDYGMYFDNNWKDDLAAMIRRDRNHPSVILWSTGNEILERDGRSGGYQTARVLADFVRALDPTRAVTNALCPIPRVNDKAELGGDEEDSWGLLTEQFAAPLDVVGYNYLRHRYASDAIRYPDRVICGTETYPSQAFDYWEETQRLKHVIGDFVWTSMDYLGEAGLGRVWYGERDGYLGKYPWLTAFCGDIDICGNKRPQSYYRDCVWGISGAPYIAVLSPARYGETPGMTLWGWPEVTPSWEWPGQEGKPVCIDIYSADDEVELLLNGRSLGRQPVGKASRYIAVFETVYEPGELVAVGYKNGIETGLTVLRTPGKPMELRLSPDRNVLEQMPGDLSYIAVEIVDDEGSLVRSADQTLTFAVSGPGSLLAVGNADPKSEEAFTGSCRSTFEGRALAVVRADGAPGDITLSVFAEGLTAAEATLTVMKAD
jgi:beta-galactosidase